MPAKEQWANWRDHPCTQDMIRQLVEDREYGFEDVSQGGEDTSLIHLGLKLGKINALTSVIIRTRELGFYEEKEKLDGE